MQPPAALVRVHSALAHKQSTGCKWDPEVWDTHPPTGSLVGVMIRTTNSLNHEAWAVGIKSKYSVRLRWIVTTEPTVNMFTQLRYSFSPAGYTEDALIPTSSRYSEAKSTSSP
jgi:hypothetical protein